MKLLTYTILNLLFLLTLLGCKKDDDNLKNPPEPDNDQEILTTIRINFLENVSGGENVSATFRDPDGPLGNGPDIFDTIFLQPNTSYSASILLLNEIVSPADTISVEVKEEGDEHLFCFEPSNVDLTITRTDFDGKYEIGLESKWETKDPGTGSVKVLLKHQPEVKDGSCNLGETDLEVDFPVVIKK